MQHILDELTKGKLTDQTLEVMILDWENLDLITQKVNPSRNYKNLIRSLKRKSQFIIKGNEGRVYRLEDFCLKFQYNQHHFTKRKAKGLNVAKPIVGCSNLKRYSPHIERPLLLFEYTLRALASVLLEKKLPHFQAAVIPEPKEYHLVDFKKQEFYESFSIIEYVAPHPKMLDILEKVLYKPKCKTNKEVYKKREKFDNQIRQLMYEETDEDFREFLNINSLFQEDQEMAYLFGIYYIHPEANTNGKIFYEVDTHVDFPTLYLAITSFMCPNRKKPLAYKLFKKLLLQNTMVLFERFAFDKDNREKIKQSEFTYLDLFEYLKKCENLNPKTSNIESIDDVIPWSTLEKLKCYDGRPLSEHLLENSNNKIPSNLKKYFSPLDNFYQLNIDSQTYNQIQAHVEKAIQKEFPGKTPRPYKRKTTIIKKINKVIQSLYTFT